MASRARVEKESEGRFSIARPPPYIGVHVTYKIRMEGGDMNLGTKQE